jgi:hypothetical protein
MDGNDENLAKCHAASYKSADVRPVSLLRSTLTVRAEFFISIGVGIMLPAKLGVNLVMQAREARTMSTAYKMAIMKAITGIRELKTEQLLGTKFTHIL